MVTALSFKLTSSTIEKKSHCMRIIRWLNDIGRPQTDPGQSSTPCPVLLEVPSPWLTSVVDGAHHRQMFTTLLRGLSRLPVELRLSEITARNDFAPRKKPDRGFTLAYHSVGEVERVWRLKETAVPGYYSFDRCGYSGWSDIARHYDRHRAAIDSFDLGQARRLVDEILRLFKANTSKYQQSDAPFEFGERFVFFPLQMLSDRVAKLYRQPSVEVLRTAARLAFEQRRHLLIKRHPLCKDESMAAAITDVSSSNPFVHVTAASVHKLLPACDAVLVANSGVGFEALFHGRPVYSFGGSEYESVTHRLSKMGDLGAVFDPQPAVSNEQRLRFLGYYLAELCFHSERLETLMPKLHRASLEAGFPSKTPEVPL